MSTLFPNIDSFNPFNSFWILVLLYGSNSAIIKKSVNYGLCLLTGALNNLFSIILTVVPLIISPNRGGIAKE